jgi:hypothetical protein
VLQDIRPYLTGKKGNEGYIDLKNPLALPPIILTPKDVKDLTEKGLEFGMLFMPGADIGEGGGASAKLIEGAESEIKSFFEGTTYSPKVLSQMKIGDYHSFLESVRAFEDAGAVKSVTGGDGITREMLEIPGSFKSKEGVFQFMKESDGTINHRLFVPNKP